MNRSPSMPLERIRLVFELERADNPRLYDELIRFKKGTKRVNRLRTLAQEGLLAQYWPIASGARQPETGLEGMPGDRDDASVTNQVFELPVTD